jgi:hypothetical protein
VVRRMAARSRATWLGSGRPVKLTPSHRLYGAGAILLDSLTTCRTIMLGGPGRALATAPYTIFVSSDLCTSSKPKFDSFTEEDIHD